MLPAVSSNETFKMQQPKRHTANTIPISTQTKPSTNIKFCHFSQKVFSCSSALQFLYTSGLQTEPSSTQLCYRNPHFRHVQNLTSISSGYSRSCGSHTCLTSVFFLLIPGAPPITEEETLHKLVLVEVKCEEHFLESKKHKVWLGTQGRLAVMTFEIVAQHMKTFQWNQSVVPLKESTTNPPSSECLSKHWQNDRSQDILSPCLTS